MSLTPKETQVVGLLREVRVAAMGTLRTRLGISRITVLRALKKHGYYSSYNFNSSYFTLEETPRFDADGLWFHEQVGFSRHGTLGRTIRAMVERSPKGSTACELVERLRTRVHNQLSVLVRTKELGRFLLGHRAVYVSGDAEQAARQRGCREREVEDARRASLDATRRARGVPEGLDALTVIRVLVRWVETPDASVASVSRTLQPRGVAIDAEGVRRVMAFYGLEKNTER
jgi:hypothetical protein